MLGWEIDQCIVIQKTSSFTRLAIEWGLEVRVIAYFRCADENFVKYLVDVEILAKC